VKKIKLDSVPSAFAPHINEPKNFHTTDFITYDFETCEVRGNGEIFGKKSELVAELMPVSVAVCVSVGEIIRSKFFSIRTYGEPR
jgi:hypothetical protein